MNLCDICHIKFITKKDYNVHCLYEHERNAIKRDLIFPLKTYYSNGKLIGYRFYYKRVRCVDVLFRKSHLAVFNKIVELLKISKRIKFYIDICVIFQTVQKFTGNIIEKREKFRSRPTDNFYSIRSINKLLLLAENELKSKVSKTLKSNPNYFVVQYLYLDIHQWPWLYTTES